MNPDTQEMQRMTADRIAAATAEFFNIKLEDLRGPSKKRQWADARHMAAVIMDLRYGIHYHTIAPALGRGEHFVCNARESVRNLRDVDATYRRQFEALEAYIVAAMKRRQVAA
jgi:chromosomal replication initiation ATPase DnaA